MASPAEKGTMHILVSAVSRLLALTLPSGNILSISRAQSSPAGTARTVLKLMLRLFRGKTLRSSINALVT